LTFVFYVFVEDRLKKYYYIQLYTTLKLKKNFINFDVSNFTVIITVIFVCGLKICWYWM